MIIARIHYRGRRLTVRELAAALRLPAQAVRWRVAHWPMRRWDEPLTWRPKLSPARAREIRSRRYEDWGALAVEYGVSRGRIGAVMRGTTWKE